MCLERRQNATWLTNDGSKYHMQQRERAERQRRELETTKRAGKHQHDAAHVYELSNVDNREFKGPWLCKTCLYEAPAAWLIRANCKQRIGIAVLCTRRWLAKPEHIKEK